MSYEIKIRRVDNGYILEWDEPYGDGVDGTVIQQEVIQDDDADELKSQEELLWRIREYFGILGSKHDTERLTIERVKKND